MAKWVIQLIIALVLGVAGQLFFKEGSTNLNVSLSGTAGPLVLVWRMITNLPIFIGMVCYGLSSIFYVLVLKEKALSMVYPMIASGYILVVLFAWLIRHEPVSPTRWLGALVITLGVVLISRS